MEDFLKSLGYEEVSKGMWQDKHCYQLAKDLETAYAYEMGSFYG